MDWPDEHPQENRATFSFKEAGSAARYERICKLLSAVSPSDLLESIAEAGNPDQAVLQMDVLLQQHAAEAITSFTSSALALRGCIALFGSSQWLGQTLQQNPDLLNLFARRRGLVSARRLEDLREQFARFRMRSHQTALPILLARFKRKEYVRIFIRELSRLGTLTEIVAEISGVADVLIEMALTHCENELRREHQGWPQLRKRDGRVYPARFAVLSLGKLGGNELNYSSDIDLLYLCDDSQDAGLIGISAHEFFTQLAQKLTSVLSAVNVEGQVFRVDLRLRPEGASGGMVAGYEQALRYYRTVAHDWELQALLKVRVSAGDHTLARAFVDELQQLIYSKRLSLSAVQTAAHSLERIQRGASLRGTRELDVKNGAGGLREIEFVVQCLQRVYGGIELWLHSSATLSALQKLHDKQHIGDPEFRELCETYELLRGIEHRLQCRLGVQSHRIPGTLSEQEAIFRSLGEGRVGNVQELKQVMSSVSDLCARVLRLGSGDAAEEVVPVSVGLGAPGAAQITRELASQSAVLAEKFCADVGDPTLRNLQRFLVTASTGEERARLTLQNVGWIERALPVFARSEMATNILARDPDDIDALFEEGERDVPSNAADKLRIASRRRILRTVGRSILERILVWKILAEHSRSFDGILQQALNAVGAPSGFAILALGRLGTCELDVVSDADLLFLRSPDLDSETAERCAHSLVAMLSSYTREGSVIAVDTRLRPHGNAGELVSSPRQLAQYFESDAKAWETLAFSKLRLVAGAKCLGFEATTSVRKLQERFAFAPEFVPELRLMRKRIADSGGSGSFKTSPGGLYDFDFLVGMLEARAALPSAGRQLPERLQSLLERELLSVTQASDLLRAGGLFRRIDHAVRVVEGRSRMWLPENDVLLASVESIVGASNLDAALRAEMVCVRKIFDCFFRN